MNSADYDEDEALRRAMELSLAEAEGQATKSSCGLPPAAAAPQIPPAASPVVSNSKEQDAADMAAAEAELAQAEQDDSEAPQIHTKSVGDNAEWEEEMVAVPVNEDLLSQLCDMGFNDTRSRKAIVHGKTLDGALAWLDEHQDDPDIDQPYMVRKSDTIPKPPLTAEEKAKKLEEMRLLIKKRREERDKHEKQEEIKREKERRERGQKIDQTLEERQKMMRKLELEKAKREKQDVQRERERLRAELARDKELRKQNKGVLPSVLGVDGYNPSIIQYDQPVAATPGTPALAAGAISSKPVEAAEVPAKRASPAGATASDAKKATPKPVTSSGAENSMSPEERVDSAIATISRYRTGGDGGQALKLLVTFFKNIVEHSEDPKYRSINTESAAYKTKLAPLIGPSAILKTVGFVKDESDGKLKYNGDVTPLFSGSYNKLVQAENLYRQMNPS